MQIRFGHCISPLNVETKQKTFPFYSSLLLSYLLLQGFNHVVLFSRPVYFCLLTSGVLILDKLTEFDFVCVAVYSVPLCSQSSVAYVKDVMLGKKCVLF